MASTISVSKSLLEKVEALIRSEGNSVQIVQDGTATVNIVEAQGRVESDDSTLYACGWIRCRTARRIAEKLGVSHKQIGMLLDVLQIKARDCELGCF